MNIFLLPGFMNNNALWDKMINKLSIVGDVIYGDLSSGESLEDLANINLKNSPNKFILIGFSLGGYVAQWMLNLAPEKIQALILIATSSELDSEDIKEEKKFL